MTRSTRTKQPAAEAAFLLVAACLSGCSSEKNGIPDGAGTTPLADGGLPSDGLAAAPTGPVLIAERFTTPDGRATFAGVFPSVPTQPILTNQLTSMGPEGKVFGCAGDVFYWNSDDSRLTKYVVNPNLSLTLGPALELGPLGVEGFTGSFVCISATQAFVFNGEGTRAVEWNPQTMTVISTFDPPKPNIGPSVVAFFFEPLVRGNLAYFPIDAVDWETLASSPRAAVGIFDASDKSLTFTYAEGCQGGNSGYLAADGTFYREGSWGAFFKRYSPTPGASPDCMLRIPAGSKEFDPAYKHVFGEVALTFPINDEFLLVLDIDPASAFPAAADPWPWFDLPVVPKRMNRQTGEMVPYPGLPPKAPMNARHVQLDGRNLYQVNTFDAEGRVTRTDVVELTPSGPSAPLFSIEGGDVLALQRL